MPEANRSRENGKKPRSPIRLIVFAIVGILIVLALANLDAVLQPLHTLNSVLAPITIGLVIAYVLNPFVRFFELKIFYRVKRKVLNRALSMLFSYLLFIVAIAGLVWLVVPQIITSINDLRLNGMFYIVRLIDSINGFFASLPIPLPGAEDGGNLVTLEKVLTYLVSLLGNYGTNIVGGLGNFASGTLTVLINILIGIFISIYVLLAKDRLNAGCRRIIHALCRGRGEELTLHYFGVAHTKFGGYVIGKLIDATTVGLMCGLLFTIFRVPYAVFVAVIVGVTALIPFFGPFFGAIPSFLIIFITSPGKAILFLLLLFAVYQVDSNLISPLLLGDRTGLSSLGVLVAVTSMAGLFGFAGLILGVPLFSFLVAVLDDYITHRLEAKGEPVSVNSYYPATAFIRPEDEPRNSATVTQRFAHWVASVETEEEGVDYVPSRMHNFGRSVRRAFLFIGRVFRRLFSIRQIPEDRAGTIYEEIMRHGMKTNRNFFRVAFRTVISLFIYPIYLIEVIAQSTNIACHRDKSRTWGAVPFLLLAIPTLGIFPLVWHCRCIARMRDYAAENGEVCRVTIRSYLLWTLLGALIVVGPLIAIGKFLSAFNQMCHLYNAGHTPTDPE